MCRGSLVGSLFVGWVHIQTAHLWWGMTWWDPRSQKEHAHHDWEVRTFCRHQKWKWKTKWRKEIKQSKSKQGYRIKEREVSRRRVRETKSLNGGSEKINLLPFMVVSVKCYSSNKQTISFEILLEGNNNTSNAEVQSLCFKIYCT